MRNGWRFGHLGFVPFFSPDPGDGSGGGGGDADAVKKAQFERDSANAKALKLQEEIDGLKKQLPSPEQLKRMTELEAQAAAADEDKKKKAGEWEALKVDLVTKHNTEVQKLKDEITSLNGTITTGEIDRAFANAFIDKTPLFGGDDALTVFTSGIAADAFRKYVSVEMKDGKPVLSVKDAAGKVVIDPKTGNPMAFGPALHEVINGLPEKNRILRGSGKTGSGNSGGGGGNTNTDQIDWSKPLTAEQMRDPKVIDAHKRRQSEAGGIVQGEAWDRMAAAKK